MSYFESRFHLDPKRTLVWSVLAPHLKKKFNFGEKILDAGCGYGDFINNVSAHSKWAIDISPEMSQFLSEEIKFLTCGLHELNQKMSESGFSTIFSSNVLEHLTREQIDDFLHASRKLLSPGGRLAILMPNYKRATKEYFDDFTHITPLSEVSLSDWLTHSGFEIEFVHPGYMPYSVKDSRLPINKLLIKLWLMSPWKPIGKQMLVIARKPLGS